MGKKVMQGDPGGGGGGGQGGRTPSEKYNTGSNPMENHKATKPAFNVRSSSACQRSAI